MSTGGWPPGPPIAQRPPSRTLRRTLLGIAGVIVGLLLVTLGHNGSTPRHAACDQLPAALQRYGELVDTALAEPGHIGELQAAANEVDRLRLEGHQP